MRDTSTGFGIVVLLGAVECVRVLYEGLSRVLTTFSGLVPFSAAPPLVHMHDDTNHRVLH